MSGVKTEGREILENFLNNIKQHEEIPKDLKMAIVCSLYKSKLKGGHQVTRCNFAIVGIKKYIFQYPGW
jgi:hypothetical protein